MKNPFKRIAALEEKVAWQKGEMEYIKNALEEARIALFIKVNLLERIEALEAKRKKTSKKGTSK